MADILALLIAERDKLDGLSLLCKVVAFPVLGGPGRAASPAETG